MNSGTEDRAEPGPPSPRAARTGTAAKWKFGVSGALALLISVAAMWWWATHRSPSVTYVTAPLTRGNIERTITATGTVNPILTIIIGSYVSGAITAMSCDYNTRVHKGQLCATVDPRPYRAVLDQAKGQLKRDQAQLKGARVDLERYKASLARNAIAQQTYDDQVALVGQLEGSVQLDRGAVEAAQVNLEYCRIISPVDGTVVARNITIGQTVASSFQTPTLFLIAQDLTKMQVDTNVSESDVGGVKEGDPSRFTVEAYTDRSFPGSVVQVRQAPQTLQNVVTYDVVVGVDNTKLLLRPGMTATVGIVTSSRTDVLRVPDPALRYQPSGLYARPGAAPRAGAAQPPGIRGAGQSAQVWVLRDGEPVAIAIGTGLDDDTYSEVVSGDLHPQDRVIVGEQRGVPSSRPGTFRFGL